MREEQLQERESADVTNAAHILGKTMGVSLDGIPSFMKPQEIPGLPKQQEGIPADHDCTICAVTAACGFFSEAQKNGGNNPLMRRLQAVQELTKSNPDILKGPDAESLIRERMDALKIQPETVITPSSEVTPTKQEAVKPAASVIPEPVSIVKEASKAQNEIPNVKPVEAAPPPIAKPDLKTTVAHFEAKVQPTLSVEKPNTIASLPHDPTPAETGTVPPTETAHQSAPPAEQSVPSAGDAPVVGASEHQNKPNEKLTENTLLKESDEPKKETHQQTGVKEVAVSETSTTAATIDKTEQQFEDFQQSTSEVQQTKHTANPSEYPPETPHQAGQTVKEKAKASNVYERL